MSAAITVIHIQGQSREAVEQALTTIFASEERPRALRIEGTYSAVLGRLLADDLEASYRYLICRPPQHASMPAALAWTPLLELGNRTVGLEAELSRLLDGAAVFTVFVYGEVVSGYRLARNGVEVDRYLSDPDELLAEDDEQRDSVSALTDVDAERGHPERFTDLLPVGTSAEDFAQTVLQPGWWQAHDQEASAEYQEIEEDDEDVIDEVDRMRCIALALELWGPTEYPFAQDAEDIPNAIAGPAIALAFA